MASSSVGAAAFAKGIRSVRHAMGNEAARPILSGVAIQGSADDLVVMACDNYRAARQVVAMGGDDWSTLGRRLIRKADVPLVLSLLAGQDVATLTVDDDDHLTIDTYERRLTITTDPRYPDVDRMLAEVRSKLADTERRPIRMTPGFVADAMRAAMEAAYVGQAATITLGGPLEPLLVEIIADLTHTEVVMAVRPTS